MIKVALIDMDGVLYDSMKYHTRAWHTTMLEEGIDCTEEEFYLYEGMTGPATINLLFQRAFGHDCDPVEAQRIYGRKSKLFLQEGKRKPMPGADKLLNVLKSEGIRCILVTGSSQISLLESLDKDYPGVFATTDRVTGKDVAKGKPHPEPYLKGLSISGCLPQETIVIENAPLGVRSGKAAGLFTVAITTGPIPRQRFEEEMADVIFPSMKEAAEGMGELISNLPNPPEICSGMPN